jgi:5-(carboxyamino)imidazole ribonucleotide mutase
MSVARRLLDGIVDAQVLVLMGSQSDWRRTKGKSPQKGGMAECVAMLDQLKVKYEVRIASAHRTPGRLEELALAVDGSDVRVIIAGAGGAAHLPGMMAAGCFMIPVIGVPIESKTLKGIDSLLSIVQMPPGVPVNTMAIGGGLNAAVAAAQIVAQADPKVRKALYVYRKNLRDSVPMVPVDDDPPPGPRSSRRKKR